ncbi:MAG: 30S ribosomal protein S12 methylthiotransferase RimO [Planctomycetota bacterium]|nr:30S ribosomal protein S12 methylthiotransferase RimO [Planctomycetota bacterium]MDA1142583.1 30S ribosomal protein S12 methylthiotransferase RimO [Planctomycetota bacterium]
MNTNQPTVSLISLGCPKTLVDSEKILGQIAESGGLICGDVDDADIIVINTCSFIEEAISESLEVIYEAVEKKEAGECKAIIVAGCLSQRFGRELKDEIPQVDVWVGVDEEHKIAGICRAVAEDQTEHCAQLQIDRTKEPLHSHAGRLRITPRHYAYLKISEGCDNVCAFCIIPSIRGRHRSKPMEVAIEEARELANDGAKELVIVAQDSTDYGRDLYERRNLAELMRRLADVEGIHWMRLLYAFPAHFTDDMIEELATNPKMCRYLDIPIQHISDNMLNLMRREVGRKETESLILKLRDRIPDLVLRTSVIVGFPGETDDDHEQLVEFLEKVKFDRLGAFRYSQEEGTAAFRRKEQVPEALKAKRLDRVMAVQQKVAFEKAQSMIGRELEILIDKKNLDHDGLWEGRSYGEAPEIDGLIYVRGRGLKVGEFTQCTISSAEGYDQYAEPVLRELRSLEDAFKVLPQNGGGESFARPMRL